MRIHRQDEMGNSGPTTSWIAISALYDFGSEKTIIINLCVDMDVHSPKSGS